MRTRQRFGRVADAESAALATTVAGAPYSVPTSPGEGGGSVPIGTVVRPLPSGCVPIAISDVEYYNCTPGVYCRAAFQGSNLVYVARRP